MYRPYCKGIQVPSLAGENVTRFRQQEPTYTLYPNAQSLLAGFEHKAYELSFKPQDALNGEF